MLPLHGLKVVELVGLAPGPFCGMILADFGADVIRVDKPSPDSPGLLTRNKRTLLLDLKLPDHLSRLRALLSCADVLIDPFRPGVLERLGLSPASLAASNPRLIVARLTGYGQDGPLAQWPGHDVNYLAVSGALSMVGPAGGPPAMPANLLADFAGGALACASGVLMALVERGRTGRGKVVDAGMADGVAYLSAFVHACHAETAMWEKGRGENLLDGGAPFYRCYETRDGKYMAVGALEPKFYRVFLEVLVEGVKDQHPELLKDPLPEQMEMDKWPILQDHFIKMFKTRTRDDWAVRFSKHPDSCVTPVLEYDEVESHFLTQTRQLVVKGEPTPAPRLLDPNQPNVPRLHHRPNVEITDFEKALGEWNNDTHQSSIQAKL